MPVGSTGTLNVSTPSGVITGVAVEVIDVVDAFTYQFRKIPYAQPPVGNLRFAKPKPIQPWNRTLDGTSFGPSCVQEPDPFFNYWLPNDTISEDCLFLNIYVPNAVDTTKTKPVMVWIHGGAYLVGQGMLYDPSYMSVKHDVIVVTINYRLGIFGFLTLQNNNAKGNYGLWDQILALKWVHKNIKSFGGDPNTVTIFGESAGGFSVSLLALIPSNKGLFHRVIAESGVSTSFDAMTMIGVNRTTEVGAAVGCTLGTAKSFLACMRNKSAGALLNATKTSKDSSSPDIHLRIGLAPVVDNELFPTSPENLLRNQSSEAFQFFKSLDLIAGNVNAEGSLLVGHFTEADIERYHFDIKDGIPYSIFCGNIVKNLAADYFKNNSKVAQAICQEYGVQDSETEQARQAVNMYTDLYFVSKTDSTLMAHDMVPDSRLNQYQFIFSRGKGRPFATKEPSWFVGAPHASEILYLFNLHKLAAIFHYVIPQADLDLSNAMMEYWTNFAKRG